MHAYVPALNIFYSYFRKKMCSSRTSNEQPKVPPNSFLISQQFGGFATLVEPASCAGLKKQYLKESYQWPITSPQHSRKLIQSSRKVKQMPTWAATVTWLYRNNNIYTFSNSNHFKNNSHNHAMIYVSISNITLFDIKMSI